jgi:aminoglycoside phosphotransferase (APT) family kinase protein
MHARPQDPNLPELSPAVRQHLYGQMAVTLAKLHSVDPQTVGLSGFGSSANYCARQVRTWGKQYRASVAVPGGSSMPEVDQLITWLEANVPAGDAEPSACICHGDYRLDNLVIDTSAGYQVRGREGGREGGR